MKLYVYANLLTQEIGVQTYDLWYSEESKKTGLWKSGDTCYQLLDTVELDISQYKFDFTSGKIHALELQLGDLHVKSENIKAQIKELQCIGYDDPISEISNEDLDGWVV